MTGNDRWWNDDEGDYDIVFKDVSYTYTLLNRCLNVYRKSIGDFHKGWKEIGIEIILSDTDDKLYKIPTLTTATTY